VAKRHWNRNLQPGIGVRLQLLCSPLLRNKTDAVKRGKAAKPATLVGLEFHPDKTRRIEFGRFAEQNRERKGEGQPETFDFLGFTQISGKNRSLARFRVRRKTIRSGHSPPICRCRGIVNRCRTALVLATAKVFGTKFPVESLLSVLSCSSEPSWHPLPGRH